MSSVNVFLKKFKTSAIIGWITYSAIVVAKAVLTGQWLLNAVTTVVVVGGVLLIILGRLIGIG